MFREDLLSDEATDVEDCESELDQQLDADGDFRSQVLSQSESAWSAVQATTGRPKGKPDAKNRTRKKRRLKRRKADRINRGLKEVGLLDSRGPKLIDGYRGWLLFFQIFAQINWLNKPLYLSIIYKATLYGLALYWVWLDYIKPLLHSNIVDTNYKNPIFVFIGLLAFLMIIVHALVITYTNLFNLCPMFKVLTTPRLCFIKTEVQHIIGSKTLFSLTCIIVYQCALFRLLCSNTFEEFLNNFSIGNFLLDIMAIITLNFVLVGDTDIDFYMRVCFGFWIIAMKRNLEYRFAYLQQHQRLVGLMNSSTGRDQRQTRLRSSGQRATSVSSSSFGYNLKLEQDQQAQLTGNVGEATERNVEGQKFANADGGNDDFRSNESLETNFGSNKRPNTARSEQTALNNFKEKYKIDTMDEIQKSLNTMDDHLEVCRGIQNSSLVMITLNAFLLNGALLLLAYNLVANRGDYYHGVIVILITLNNTFGVFMCYIGDSWISYALGSFVQTVEDEYFLQGGDSARVIQEQQLRQQYRNSINEVIDDSKSNNSDPVLPPDWSIFQMKEPSTTGSELQQSIELIRQHQSLFLIKKEDVQFCREFLQQFKNHLATPWSKLTVKIHLHMVRTFVTLIAAQIIFDREH